MCSTTELQPFPFVNGSVPFHSNKELGGGDMNQGTHGSKGESIPSPTPHSMISHETC